MGDGQPRLLDTGSGPDPAKALQHSIRTEEAVCGLNPPLRVASQQVFHKLSIHPQQGAVATEAGAEG
jgi:hypothetical protein